MTRAIVLVVIALLGVASGFSPRSITLGRAHAVSRPSTVVALSEPDNLAESMQPLAQPSTVVAEITQPLATDVLAEIIQPLAQSSTIVAASDPEGLIQTREALREELKRLTTEYEEAERARTAALAADAAAQVTATQTLFITGAAIAAGRSILMSQKAARELKEIELAKSKGISASSSRRSFITGAAGAAAGTLGVMLFGAARDAKKSAEVAAPAKKVLVPKPSPPPPVAPVVPSPPTPVVASPPTTTMTMDEVLPFAGTVAVATLAAAAAFVNNAGVAISNISRTLSWPSTSTTDDDVSMDEIEEDLNTAQATAAVKTASADPTAWPMLGGMNKPGSYKATSTAREEWVAPPGYTPPKFEWVASWYDRGDRLNPPVTSWYDTGSRLQADVEVVLVPSVVSWYDQGSRLAAPPTEVPPTEDVSSPSSPTQSDDEAAKAAWFGKTYTPPPPAASTPSSPAQADDSAAKAAWFSKTYYDAPASDPQAAAPPASPAPSASDAPPPTSIDAARLGAKTDKAAAKARRMPPATTSEAKAATAEEEAATGARLAKLDVPEWGAKTDKAAAKARRGWGGTKPAAFTQTAPSPTAPEAAPEATAASEAPPSASTEAPPDASGKGGNRAPGAEMLSPDVTAADTAPVALESAAKAAWLAKLDVPIWGAKTDKAAAKAAWLNRLDVPSWGATKPSASTPAAPSPTAPEVAPEATAASEPAPEATAASEPAPVAADAPPPPVSTATESVAKAAWLAKLDVPIWGAQDALGPSTAAHPVGASESAAKAAWLAKLDVPRFGPAAAATEPEVAVAAEEAADTMTTEAAVEMQMAAVAEKDHELYAKLLQVVGGDGMKVPLDRKAAAKAKRYPLRRSGFARF